MSATPAQAIRHFYVILSPTLVPEDPELQMVYLPWRKTLDPYWTTTCVSWVKTLRLWGLPPEHSLLIQGMPGQSGEVPGSTQHKFIYRISQPSGQGLKCHSYNVSLFHREEGLSWGWQGIGFADFYTDGAPRTHASVAWGRTESVTGWVPNTLHLILQISFLFFSPRSL